MIWHIFFIFLWLSKTSTLSRKMVCYNSMWPPVAEWMEILGLAYCGLHFSFIALSNTTYPPCVSAPIAQGLFFMYSLQRLCFFLCLRELFHSLFIKLFSSSTQGSSTWGNFPQPPWLGQSLPDSLPLRAHIIVTILHLYVRLPQKCLPLLWSEALWELFCSIIFLVPDAKCVSTNNYSIKSCREAGFDVEWIRSRYENKYFSSKAFEVGNPWNGRHQIIWVPYPFIESLLCAGHCARS